MSHKWDNTNSKMSKCKEFNMIVPNISHLPNANLTTSFQRFYAENDDENVFLLPGNRFCRLRDIINDTRHDFSWTRHKIMEWKIIGSNWGHENQVKTFWACQNNRNIWQKAYPLALKLRTYIRKSLIYRMH